MNKNAAPFPSSSSISSFPYLLLTLPTFFFFPSSFFSAASRSRATRRAHWGHQAEYAPHPTPAPLHLNLLPLAAFNFAVKDHVALAEDLGMVDLRLKSTYHFI
jgi:hypothetical protein